MENLILKDRHIINLSYVFITATLFDAVPEEVERLQRAGFVEKQSGMMGSSKFIKLELKETRINNDEFECIPKIQELLNDYEIKENFNGHKLVRKML